MTNRNIHLEQLTQNELVRQLAFQCAPLLMGIKVSNIFIVSRQEEQKVKVLFRGSVISYEVLFKCDKRIIFLLYDKIQLQKHISEETQQCLMRQLGYTEHNLESIIKKLAQRYQCYMTFKEQFPHELGVLLGYPHEDVEAFIKYHGKGCLCSGYWKVYYDVQTAEKTFKSYDRAKQMVIKMVDQGMTIHEIIEKYHQKKRAQQLVVI